MSNTGRNKEPPKEAHENTQKDNQDKPKKPRPSLRADDDDDDGDMATPKRDRHGNDDEPL